MTGKISESRNVLLRAVVTAGVTPAIAGVLLASAALAQTPQSPQSQQTAAPVQHPSAALSDQDRTFLEKAARGSMMQVALGRLAAQKAPSPVVRQFGLQSVARFSRADGMLQAVANDVGVQLPQTPSPDARKLAQALAADPATVIGEEYLAQVVPASTVTLNLFKSEAADGQNPKLRQFASQMLPKLQQQRKVAVRLAENPSLRQAMRNNAFPPKGIVQ